MVNPMENILLKIVPKINPKGKYFRIKSPELSKAQMNVITMSSIKAWTLYVIAVVILLFKNWIQYSGKRRNILNAKQKRKSGYSIWTLWLIPIICVFLSILMLKVF